MLRVFGVSLACDKCFVCLSSAVSCLWPVFGVSVSIRRVACMLLQHHATAAHCNTPPRIMSLRPLIWVAVFMHFFGDLFRVLNLSRRYLTDLCNDFRVLWEQGAIHSIWFDRTEYDGGVQIIGCANSYHTPPRRGLYAGFTGQGLLFLRHRALTWPNTRNNRGTHATHPCLTRAPPECWDLHTIATHCASGP